MFVPRRVGCYTGYCGAVNERTLPSPLVEATAPSLPGIGISAGPPAAISASRLFVTQSNHWSCWRSAPRRCGHGKEAYKIRKGTAAGGWTRKEVGAPSSTSPEEESGPRVNQPPARTRALQPEQNLNHPTSTDALKSGGRTNKILQRMWDAQQTIKIDT